LSLYFHLVQHPWCWQADVTCADGGEVGQPLLEEPNQVCQAGFHYQQPVLLLGGLKSTKRGVVGVIEG